MALAARAVLGCGDAMTFVSVLRLGSRWFPARRGPMIAQGAALFGVAGNLVSTVVLVPAAALGAAGRRRSWARRSAAPSCCVLVALFLKDHPEGYEPAPAEHARTGVRAAADRRAWREPGTRLGMWTHFTTQFSGMVFLLLWGLPYLVEDQGLSRGTAGGLLTLVVLANMVFGMLFGQLHLPPPRRPDAADAGRDRGDRGRVGGGAGLARRPGPDVAAGACCAWCWAPAAPAR